MAQQSAHVLTTLARDATGGGQRKQVGLEAICKSKTYDARSGLFGVFCPHDAVIGTGEHWS